MMARIWPVPWRERGVDPSLAHRHSDPLGPGQAL